SNCSTNWKIRAEQRFRLATRIWGAHAPRVLVCAPPRKHFVLDLGSDRRGRRPQHARTRALPRKNAAASRPTEPKEIFLAFLHGPAPQLLTSPPRLPKVPREQ